MHRVLITGASGFVGRHCLHKLQGMAEIHAVYHSRLPDPLPGIEAHQADLFRDSEVNALLARIRPTHLLHLAWNAKPGEFWNSPENHRWVTASETLVRAFADNGGQRVVSAGTCAEYDWSAGTCQERRTPMQPATLYGKAKQTFWQRLERCAGESGIEAACGRIFFLYGPHEHPRRLVASVVNSLLSERPALCSEGRQQRDFLYVEDVADAFVKLLQSRVCGPVNVAAGQTVSVREVVAQLAERLGRQDLVRFGSLPTPQGDPPVISADTTRLRDEVKWAPRHSLEEGLDRTVQWWRRRLAVSRAA